MAISYNSGTDTITVTGYTEATPCNFTDIYNADVAGGWGVVTRQCTNQFCIACKIVIGDGSTATWFADTDTQIMLTKDSSGNTFYTMVNSNIILGAKTASVGAKDGCHFYGISVTDQTIFRFEGTTKLYACTFDHNVYGLWHNVIYFDMTTTLEVIDCFFDRMWGTFIYSVPSTMLFLRNKYISGDMILANYTGGTLTMSDITIFDSKRAICLYMTGVTTNVTNLKFIGCDYCCDIGDHSVLNLYDSTLIDGAIWDRGSGWTINEYYHLDIQVVDKDNVAINGATVKIWDKDNNLIVDTTTGVGGNITQQAILRDVYSDSFTPVIKTPHEMRIYEYGKSMLSSKSSIEAKTDWALTMLTDDHITETTEATVAAYSGITINHTAETIIISEDHTLDEIYDYCQYDIISSTKQIDQTIHTADGVNFVSGYSFVVDTGITVTATDQKLSMVSGETYTLTGTAQFTGIVATTTTTRIPVKLTNIIDGSRYWVGKSSDGSEIFKGTQSGSGTVTGYYEHTANIDIDIRVRKSSTSVKYLPWVGDGTLIAAAFSLRIRQIQDNIVT